MSRRSCFDNDLFWQQGDSRRLHSAVGEKLQRPKKETKERSQVTFLRNPSCSMIKSGKNTGNTHVGQGECLGFVEHWDKVCRLNLINMGANFLDDTRARAAERTK